MNNQEILERGCLGGGLQQQGWGRGGNCLRRASHRAMRFHVSATLRPCHYCLSQHHAGISVFSLLGNHLL